MNVLVIAAHPDDEVLGCGGTISRLAQEGNDVYVAILGEGLMARYDERLQANRGDVEKLADCSRKAGKILGAKKIYFHGLPDNRFDTVALLDIVKMIEKLISEIRPQIVYTHHSGDLNIDHTITSRATITATRPFSCGQVKELYAYEVSSSTECSFHSFNSAFKPTVFIDISNTIENKIKALEVFVDEIRPFPHPRSVQSIRALAMTRGFAAGMKMAEAFEVVRYLRTL